MKIDMNPVGNYSPVSVRNVNRQARTTETTQTQAAQKTEQTKSGALTSEEKTFFANLYPANKTEVVDYHFYEKSGRMSGVKIGSLFDRRG